MATVVFSSFIQGYVKCPSMDAPGNSVREVLENYFQEFRTVRSYILDDQGCIRPRLAVFVDGAVVEDRIDLTDPVHLHARVFVQAMPIDSEYDFIEDECDCVRFNWLAACHRSAPIIAEHSRRVPGRGKPIT